MIVVMIDPDPQRLSASLFAVVGPGVEDLVDHQPVVAFDFAVAFRSVGPDGLMPMSQSGHRVMEQVGAVVVAVVGNDPVDADAVGGVEGSGPMEESRGRRLLLVLERLGVGQAGVPIDGRVQIRIADSGSGAALGGLGVAVAPAVDLAAPPSGMVPTFFTSRCSMAPGCSPRSPTKRCAG